MVVFDRLLLYSKDSFNVEQYFEKAQWNRISKGRKIKLTVVAIVRTVQFGELVRFS